MNQNKKKDGACRIAEIPAINTSSTESTETSTETTPRTPSSFSPANNSVDCTSFRTPHDRTIEISYELLGLTPTKMLPIKDVLTKMQDDEAWNISPKKQGLTFRLIVFLYGKGYYSELPRDDRISRIQQCIKPVGGNRARLSAIACSHESHQVLAHPRGFEIYFYMASTARMFFKQPNARGGFPGEAYCRVQGSSNCYIAAVCNFVTVKLQRDYPEQNQLPIDDGYIGRRYVIDTLEGLERRVIHDKGDNAIALCEKVIGRCDECVGVNCKFKGDSYQYSQESQRRLLDDFMDHDAVGLVTGFCVCPKFRERSEEKNFPEAIGYWKFDDNSIDCEGEFVRMDADEKVVSERVRLQTIWEEQLDLAQKAMKRNNRKMKDVVDMSPRKDYYTDDDTDDTKDNAKDNAKIDAKDDAKDSSGARETHASVMLGCLTEKVDGHKKKLYMLWNSWAFMPLVLVSFEYLVACQCKIFFLTRKLDADIIPTAKRSEALASECCFPDHAENTRFNEWEGESYSD